jgi:hypothetical protein
LSIPLFSFFFPLSSISLIFSPFFSFPFHVFPQMTSANIFSSPRPGEAVYFPIYRPLFHLNPLRTMVQYTDTLTKMYVEEF